VKAAREGLLQPGDAAVLGIERKGQFQYLAFEMEWGSILRPAQRLGNVMAGECRPGGRAYQNPAVSDLNYLAGCLRRIPS
jgi:hypothetical protein